MINATHVVAGLKPMTIQMH